MSMIVPSAIVADIVKGHMYEVPSEERGDHFMALPVMKQTMPNFLKLLIGRDPCFPEIDRS
jgi:hypothetical protein